MRYKYSFHNLENARLIEWLETNNVRYFNRGRLICFDIWSNSSNCSELLSQLKGTTVIGPITTAEFTPSEILRAEYLMLCPKKQCIDIINRNEAYHYSCTWTNPYGVNKSGHEEQKSLFAIAKEPSTKTKTAFWHEDTGFSEIFTDRRVYDLVSQNGLTGVEFKNVLLKKGEISKNIYQMTSPNKIIQEWIDFGHGEKKLYCEKCGKEQFFINSAYQLHLNMSLIDNESDLYVTERIWGEGRPGPLYLISQRFYRLLKDNKLTGNLFLLPVVEVNR